MTPDGKDAKMFCAHDPGLALFLAESSRRGDAGVGPLAWMAFAATLILAVFALGVPA